MTPCRGCATRRSLGSATSATNNLGQHIPLAVADTTTFPVNIADDPPTPAADYYEIALVQYRKCMSSSCPRLRPLLRGPVRLETLLREYVQLSGGSGVALLH